jgi:hypothetical protein
MDAGAASYTAAVDEAAADGGSAAPPAVGPAVKTPDAAADGAKAVAAEEDEVERPRSGARSSAGGSGHGPATGRNTDAGAPGRMSSAGDVAKVAAGAWGDVARAGGDVADATGDGSGRGEQAAVEDRPRPAGAASVADRRARGTSVAGPSPHWNNDPDVVKTVMCEWPASTDLTLPPSAGSASTRTGAKCSTEMSG